MDSSSGHSKTTDDNVDFEDVLGLETKEEKLKKFRNCLEPLRENQIQVDTFTVSDMLNLGYTLNQMVKHVRVLTTITFKDVRDSVFIRANSLGLCPLNHNMITLRHIVEVCQWMKTKSGIEALVEVQRSEKLKRRANAKGMTLVEACMIRAINAQFNEFSDKIKEVDHIMREEDFNAIRDKYWPASVLHICNIVSEESVLDFCRKHQEVKSKLIEYVKGLIDGEENVYSPQHKVGVLRAVLEGMNHDSTDVQASCEGENSNLNGKHCVGMKRKDATVLCRDEEPMFKIRSHKK